LETSLNARIDGSETGVNALETSLNARIESLRAEVQGLRGEFQELRLDVRQKWEHALDIHERLATIEAKLQIR
jgi:hypothetical protein